jgi:hypothetical protein
VSTTCPTRRSPPSQYSLVRSANSCRYDRASHRCVSPRLLHRLVRPRIGYPLCGAAEFASGLIANGLPGSMVICCGKAKQIPLADAFPRKQSPSSLSKSSRTVEFPCACARAGSPNPTDRFARCTGGDFVVRAVWPVIGGIAIKANRRRAGTAGKELIRHGMPAASSLAPWLDPGRIGPSPSARSPKPTDRCGCVAMYAPAMPG